MDTASPRRTDVPPRPFSVADADPSELEQLHAGLLRYARSRLANPTWAEDAVSETLLAALSAPVSFAALAHARAWLFGVLRHKLVDQLRQQGRESAAGDLAADDGEPDDGAWRGAGAWCGGPDPWQDPETACRQRQFLQALQRCCRRLPPAQAVAFEMWEVAGIDAATICSQLRVTEAHLWVLLHRARQRLQQLLQGQWRVAVH